LFETEGKAIYLLGLFIFTKKVNLYKSQMKAEIFLNSLNKKVI
jgi:hypothetical protein